MSGRYVYAMNVSLDLFIEHHPDEAGAGSWLRIDEPLHQAFNDRTRGFAALVQGRVTHEIMEGYWPGAAVDPEESQVAREFGQIWMNVPKYLVSTTRTHAGHNTQIISGPDVIAQLRDLRDHTDGDIGVGGATLATSLLRHDLLDELHLAVHPVVLGTGRPLFDSLPHPLECDLVDHQGFASGVTLSRLQIRKGRRTAAP